MDTQPTSPNMPGSEVTPGGSRPENFPNEAMPARPETAPAPGGSPATPPPAAGSPAAPPPKLSASDVAAAIAAVPGGPTQNVPVPTPSTAEDVDVIEPEWVAKAEDVVREHHDDPYGEEEAIQGLQQDYLQKRYGVNVADPDADSSKPEGT